MMTPLGLLLILLSKDVSCYRILAFLPFPARSHQNAFLPLLKGLAERGHHVVYLTSLPPGLTHPRLEVRRIRPFAMIFKDRINLRGLGTAPKFLVPHMMGSTAVSLAKEFYGDPVAQDIIHGSESFDAVIMESFFLQEPVSALAHKYSCPAIEVSSLGDIPLVIVAVGVGMTEGLPDNPSYQMDFKSRLSDRMTFPERLYNWYVTWSTVLVSYYYLWRMEYVASEYFNYTGWETRPPLRSLVSNKSLILINRDISVASYPFPVAPHVRNIGGLNILPNKPLTKDIQKFMDDAEAGVIYFSLGSNLKTCDISSGEVGEILVGVFREVPQKILMKWEFGDPSSLPANVMTSKWFPQQDILAHNNCKLFITHGGFLSLTESVYHGVPVLGIPFFGDQFKNMKQVEVSGYGLNLDSNNITKESVVWALTELLNKTSYREEAVRRSLMMRERLSNGLDEAIYWVEHAIKYPNSLTPRAAHLTFTQIHLIDIYLFIFVVLFSAYRLILFMFNNKSKNKDKRKEKLN